MQHELMISALNDAQVQLGILQDAWWKLNDSLRLLKSDDEEILEILNRLDQMQSLTRNLNMWVNLVASSTSSQQDRLRMDLLTTTAKEQDEVRERLAQIDLNLNKLYSKLKSMCKFVSNSVAAECNTKPEETDAPIWNVEITAKLDYMLKDSNPLYDEKSNNVLGKQEAIWWHVTAKDVKDFAMDDDFEVDNWLDYPHPFMKHQSWLTHDILEHDYGPDRRAMGIAELLSTDTIMIEIRTTRTYAYDLRQGKFWAPE